MEIVALDPEAWETLREVRLRSLAEAPHAFSSTYAREVAFTDATWRGRARGSRTYLARDGDLVVGTATGVAGWSGDPARRELVGMWVAPTHRGRGVARALLEAVADWARLDGATTLSLGVLRQNTVARAAYRRMGLRAAVTGRPVGAAGSPDLDVVELELELGSGFGER